MDLEEAERSALVDKQASEIFEPYVEEADANPERQANGCMIYKVGAP
jgi:hypothetical protein